MKPFRMHYYYLAPLMVLAIVACAKRDNDFAKKAAEARAAAQQKVANKDQKQTPTVDKGGTATATTKADDKAGTTKDSKQDPSYQGDLESKKSCDNKISMEVDEKEEQLAYSDIVDEKEGTYILQSTELFINNTDESEIATQVNTMGVPFNLSENKDDVRGKNVNVVCHTVDMSEKSTQKISGNLTLPYEISTKDGSVKHLRLDKVALSKSDKNAESRIYLNSNEEYNLKKILESESKNTKVLLVRTKGSSDFVLKIQTKKTSDTGVVTKTLKGTYSLKK